MTPEHNRRKDDTRITELEGATRNLEEEMRNRKREHGETLSSLSALQKRQGQVIDENRIGTREIQDDIAKVTATVQDDITRVTETIQAEFAKLRETKVSEDILKAKECADCRLIVGKSDTRITLSYLWLTGLTGFGAWLANLFISHHDKIKAVKP